MIKVKYPIIVEGKYDKTKLASLVEGDIIVTNGFAIFKNKDKLNYIKKLSQAGKIILLTDSDRAGFKIRGYLTGCVPVDSIIHLYIPQILGKEKRKIKASAEGTLGVEGVPADILRKAFTEAGVIVGSEDVMAVPITKQQLFSLGLSGRDNSLELRRQVQKHYELPIALSANGLCGALTRITTIEELTDVVAQLTNDSTVN